MQRIVEVFGLEIPTYGICAFLGLAAGVGLLLYTHKKYPHIPLTELLYFTCFCVIGGFLGAKLLYVIVELPEIIENPQRLLTALRGGLVFYGGLIGGAGAGVIYALKYKLPLAEVFDLILPSLALGQAFGRVGCFFAGCCYGRVCESPFSVVYPEGSYPPSGVPVLATQLLEAGFLLLFTVALVIVLKKSKTVWTASGVYCIGYAVWRFFIEFYRNDPRGAVGGLSTSQFISIFIFIAGVVILTVLRRAAKKKATGD